MMSLPLDEHRFFLHEHADHAEAEGRLPDALADWFRAHGLWKLWVPEAYGGTETPLPESVRLIEALAAVDGALGWALAIGAGGGLFAGWLPDESARTIFAPDDVLIAGSGAPGGVRVPADGGFRVTGSWRYASLIGHATWMTGTTLLHGTPETPLAIATPAETVRTEPTWQTWALRGSGSHDVHLQDVHVPEAFTFDLLQPARIEAPLYRFPFMTLAECSFAAVGVGLGQGALDRFSAHEGRRTLGGGAVRVMDQPAVEVRLQRLRTAVQDGRDRLHDLLATGWAAVETKGTWPAPGPAEAARACTALVTDIWHAVDALADAGGMGILYADNRWGRIWRNLRGLRQHILLSPLRHES